MEIKDAKITLNISNVFLNGLRPMPNVKIAINSLSLFSLIKHKRRPNIIIKGIITVIIFGIR